VVPIRILFIELLPPVTWLKNFVIPLAQIALEKVRFFLVGGIPEFAKTSDTPTMATGWRAWTAPGTAACQVLQSAALSIIWEVNVIDDSGHPENMKTAKRYGEVARPRPKAGNQLPTFESPMMTIVFVACRFPKKQGIGRATCEAILATVQAIQTAVSP